METKQGKNYNEACEKQTLKGESGIRVFYKMYKRERGSCTVLILLSKAHYVKKGPSDTPEMES